MLTDKKIQQLRNDELDNEADYIECMREQLFYIRSLICEAAETGFNPTSGDWAYSLYRSNSQTTHLLDKE